MAKGDVELLITIIVNGQFCIIWDQKGRWQGEKHKTSAIQFPKELAGFFLSVKDKDLYPEDPKFSSYQHILQVPKEGHRNSKASYEAKHPAQQSCWVCHLITGTLTDRCSYKVLRWLTMSKTLACRCVRLVRLGKPHLYGSKVASYLCPDTTSYNPSFLFPHSWLSAEFAGRAGYVSNGTSRRNVREVISLVGGLFKAATHPAKDMAVLATKTSSSW